ncbi:kelch repeat-containing protein [uncultured Shewanella sp.]|uniref:Kelch repeat-containing protein n=1 Tax=uncultured Shewanella sp. TaxID=173975 RepID=UPI002604B15A|nr:kelch repeat-containing protein [uncultured Shewanella sp.]
MGITRRQFIQSVGATSILGIDSFSISQVLAMPLNYVWRTGAELATPIQEIYPAVFDGEIFVGGGFVPKTDSIFYGLSPTTNIYIYNPHTQTWRLGPVLPEARHHLGMVSNNRFLYGMGGFYGVKGNAWQIKDTVLRLTKKSHEWEDGPSLPMPMAESIYASIKDNIHVVGGKTLDQNAKKSVDLARHFVLVDNNKWEEAAPASVSRSSATSAVLNDNLYVIGGRQYGKLSRNLGYAEVYDEKIDKWKSISPLPVPLAGLAATVLNGKIFVTGGEAFGSNGHWKTGRVFQQVWVYDPDRDLWERERDMPEARHGHGSVTINDSIYVIGGGSKVGPQGTRASLLVFSQ